GEIKASGAITAASATLSGALNAATVNGTSGIIGQSTLGGGSIELNSTGTGNRNSFIDFHSTDGTDFDLRILRGSSGANANSTIQHKGAGALALQAVDGGAIQLVISGVARFAADSTGIGFFGVAATPVVRQTGGAATAGATYTATEQGMINRM